MISLLSVIRFLTVRVFLFLLLTVFYPFEAEILAQRRIQRHTSINSRLVSKPGCIDRCGNISIPFPFGMGASDCYYSPYYEIDCDYSVNPRVPSLAVPAFSTGADTFIDQKMKKYNVLEITQDNIRVNMLASVTCDHGSSSTNVTTGTNYITYFPVSNSFNKLIVLGCNIFGSVTEVKAPMTQVHGKEPEGQAFFEISVCMSFCFRHQNISSPSPCAGYGCCKTTIPKGLFIYSIDTTRAYQENFNPSYPHPCSRAFLADHEFSGVDELMWSREDALVPVILDWSMHDYDTCEDAAQRNSSMKYACGANTDCVDSPNGPGYRCKCSNGYGGNPYLLDGCQDINECDDFESCNEASCINTIGSYHCICPAGTIPSTVEGRLKCKPDKRKYFIIVVVSSGFGVCILIILLVVMGYKLYNKFERRKQKKIKQKHFARNGGLLLKQKITSNDGRVEKDAKIFLTEELEKATDDFNPSRIIGKGGFGTVFKGMLANGELVAIKKSKLVDENQVDQFINEVAILSQINHRHIVKLLGCCLETEVPLLVYEFVSNRTLSYHLHVDEGDTESLVSWKDRLRIAYEVSGALAYLHSDAYMPIFHRDIKSTNILLDDKYKAKVADFGISRSTAIDKTHLTTLVQGTFGYLDPEYFHSSQFTDKSDVYSFGVVLVELLTGEKVISQSRHEQEKGLNIYFINAMKQNRLFEILDARVLNEGDKDDIFAVAKLAKRCLKYVGKKRPTMKEVSHALGGLNEKLSRSRESLN